jgi:ribosomal protein L31E
MAEKEYVIRYNDAVRIPRTRFANKVLQATRAFVKKHTHANNGDIRISADVNAAIWERGMNHKLNKLNVVIRKKDGNVWVFTPEGKDLKAFEKAATPTKKKETKAAKTEATTEKVEAAIAKTEAKETKPAKTTASKAKAKSEQ